MRLVATLDFLYFLWIALFDTWQNRYKWLGHWSHKADIENYLKLFIFPSYFTTIKNNFFSSIFKTLAAKRHISDQPETFQHGDNALKMHLNGSNVALRLPCRMFEIYFSHRRFREFLLWLALRNVSRLSNLNGENGIRKCRKQNLKRFQRETRDLQLCHLRSE